MGDTGVHLGAGLYFGLDGHHHGEFRGELHVDGERIADCRTARGGPPPPPDPRHGRARRPTRWAGGSGWGNCQTVAAGPWPELGLGDDPWM